MECRSEERRQYIVDNYNVVPVAHIQLLNGRQSIVMQVRPLKMIIIFLKPQARQMARKR